MTAWNEVCPKGHVLTLLTCMSKGGKKFDSCTCKWCKRIFLVIYQPKPIATGPKRPRGRPRKWVMTVVSANFIPE